MKLLRCFLIMFVVSFIFTFKVNASVLNDLEIGEYVLVPKFSTNIYSYNIFLRKNITKLSLRYKCDERQVEKEYSLEEGKNVVNLTCDDKRNYTLKIFRGTKKFETGLSDLKVFGHDIGFSEDTYEYEVSLEEDEDILDIDYTLINDSDLIDITGNGGFEKGNKTVVIKVFNDQSEKEYRINVVKAQQVSKDTGGIFKKQELSKTEKILIAGVISVVGLLIIYIFYKLLFKKKKKL